MDIKKIFNEFSEVFSTKIDRSYFIRLEFELIDLENNNICQIEVKDGVVNVYNEKRIIPDEIFILTSHTLRRLYNNELSPYTAFASSLIDIKHKSNEKFLKANEIIEQEKLGFIDRLHKFNDFFSRDYTGKIVVKVDNCMKLHGIDGIGLFTNFSKGIIHAFFTIKQNEILKQSPIECSIYVLQGKGTLRINNEEYMIKKDEYYHINPQSYIYIENKEEDCLNILYFGMRKIDIE